MKQYILGLFVTVIISLPIPSRAIDREITSLIVGSAGLASLVATLFVQPDYTAWQKNATSEQELDDINKCAEDHARDIAMLKQAYTYVIKHLDADVSLDMSILE